MMRRRLHNLAVASATTIGLLIVTGCGDDTGLAKRYPVQGTVTYQGKPVENGQITFTPTKSDDSSRPAGGTILEGKYTLTTANPDDGALPGEYLVSVASKQVDDAKVKETINKQGGGARQHEVAKAQSKAKNLIPAKYALPDTSGLTASVKAQSNTIDFDLKD